MPNTMVWLQGLRSKMMKMPKIVDVARDIGIGEKGYKSPLGKTMLGTLAAGFLLKKIIDSADLTHDDAELTELIDRLYYNR